jgi:hypothetical protein
LKQFDYLTMRLINATTLKVHEFLNEFMIPPFAILSHTWEEEECTLQQMTDAKASRVTKRKGFTKILLCCKQALKDELQWAWVDTQVLEVPQTQNRADRCRCCIDKTSTAELSEAINSMFRWYRKASICYVYLTDVKDITQLASSRWFTRGWTLQELISPSKVWFYNANWEYLGSKRGLSAQIQQITNIDALALETGIVATVSIARRMSWAATRRTTRVEDRAYSLMGIFDVNMPLLYGEGEKAFHRLQEEIMRTSDDQSLFAWGLPAQVKTMQEYLETSPTPNRVHMRGLFADSPSDFTFSDCIHVLQDLQSTVPPMVFNNGVRIELQVKRPDHAVIQFAVIYCTMRGRYKHYLAFPILSWSDKWVARCGELVTIAVSDLVTHEANHPYRKPQALLIRAPVRLPKRPDRTNILGLVHVANQYRDFYVLENVHCSAHASYSSTAQTLTISEETDNLHAVFYFKPKQSEIMSYPPQATMTQCVCGEHLDKTILEKNHIIVRSRGMLYHDKFSAMHPPFAVLVGGIGTNSWAEVVVLLSDDDPDADFHRLQRTGGELIRSCITRQYLDSLIQSHPIIEPLCGRRRQLKPQQVMSWNVGGGCSKRFPDLRHKNGKSSGGLSVSAQIQMASGNLVEHNLTLFVEITEQGGQGANQSPGWWGFGE